jgi:Protein of unknown function (DUF3592)
MAIAHYLEGVVAFLAAGLALLTMWGWLVTRYRLRRGGGASGQVIGTKVRSGITSAPGYTYWTARHAVVRYVDRTGQAHTMEAARELPSGHQVPLAYNPARPQRAAELTRATELRGAVACLAVALGLVLAILLT